MTFASLNLRYLTVDFVWGFFFAVVEGVQGRELGLSAGRKHFLLEERVCTHRGRTREHERRGNYWS